MARRKEFWFALILLSIGILPLFAIEAVQQYGRFMMVMNHNTPHTDAAAFATAIYQTTTRPLFISIGFLCAWFFLFSSWEVLLLIMRIRNFTQAQFSTWIFIFALLPAAIIFSVATYKYLRG
jgi:hypothetical protein